MLDCIFCVSAGLSQGSIQMPAGLILQLKSISAPTGRIYHLWTGFTCNAACLKLSAVCISSLPWIPLCLLLFFFFFFTTSWKTNVAGECFTALFILPRTKTYGRCFPARRASIWMFCRVCGLWKNLYILGSYTSEIQCLELFSPFLAG